MSNENENKFSIFRVNRIEGHPYWGNEISLVTKKKDNNLEEIKKEDEANNRILREAGVEKLLYEALFKEEKRSEDDKKEAYIFKKENRYHKEDEENVYISLRFGIDENRKHWSEARISVFNGELCVVRHKARGNKYNYYPIEDGKLEESIAKAVRHPMKW